MGCSGLMVKGSVPAKQYIYSPFDFLKMSLMDYVASGMKR